MELIVSRDDLGLWQVEIAGRKLRCAIGRGGVSACKREGDGATPIGVWPLRRLHYRADRVERPQTALPLRVLKPDDGWCDDPADAAYNRLIKLPYPSRHERLWREDGLYDVIGELGYNDRPPRPGDGSAIFLHIARPGFAPTEGCVALRREDLLSLLPLLTAASHVVVKSPD